MLTFKSHQKSPSQTAGTTKNTALRSRSEYDSFLFVLFNFRMMPVYQIQKSISLLYAWILQHNDAAILVICVFLLVLWMWPEPSAKCDTENEYAFLSTHASLPSQFHLVRAFLIMGRHEKAVELLEKLSAALHPRARTQARQWLNELKRVGKNGLPSFLKEDEIS